MSEEPYTRVSKTLWFCKICHTRFEAAKNSIATHERTQKHKQNHEKNLNEIIKKNRMKDMTEEEKVQAEREYLDKRNKARYTGNYEEFKKSTQAQKKPGDLPYSSGYGETTTSTGPGANNTGASKKFGEINKGKQKQNGFNKNKREEDRIKARFDSDFSLQSQNIDFNQVWKLYKDEMGQLYFYNMITKLKSTERPRGVKLQPYEEKIWEEYQKKHEDQGPVSEVNQAISLVGAWEVVDETEDFYKRNIVHDDNNNEDKEEEEVQDILDDIKFNAKIDEFETGKGSLDDLLDLNKIDHGKTALKSKSDKLKMLVESNIEHVSKPTFQKNKGTINDTNQDEYKEIKGSVAFKKRNTNKQQKALVDFVLDEDANEA